MKNNKILFISHSEKDSKIVSLFVDLLYQIGVPEKNLFCSSISGIDVPIKEDIYNYLRDLLNRDSVVPIFMLSDNYYRSPACLNEMGAVWITQKNYFTFLLPGFEFKQIKGAINPNKRAIKLDREINSLKGDLSNFKNELCKMFGLNISDNRWERKRDSFLESIQNINNDIIFDIADCQGYCIGEINYDGCLVTVDKTLNKVIANINFYNTKAELCSLVFFTNGINIQSEMISNKKLQFCMRTNGDIKKVIIEVHLNTRNFYYKDEIHLSDEWAEYNIPLYEFCKLESEWTNFKELCFITNRRTSSSGVIEVKNIKIS